MKPPMSQKQQWKDKDRVAVDEKVEEEGLWMPGIYRITLLANDALRAMKYPRRLQEAVGG